MLKLRTPKVINISRFDWNTLCVPLSNDIFSFELFFIFFKNTLTLCFDLLTRSIIVLKYFGCTNSDKVLLIRTNLILNHEKLVMLYLLNNVFSKIQELWTKSDISNCQIQILLFVLDLTWSINTLLLRSLYVQKAFLGTTWKIRSCRWGIFPLSSH